MNKPAPPFDRSDPAYAKQVIQHLLPDAENRRLVLQLMADCIRINAEKPATWGITLNASGVNLNVGGRYYTVHIRIGGVTIYGEPAKGTDALPKFYPFKTQPDITRYKLTHAQIADWFPRLTPFVLSFVRRVLPLTSMLIGRAPFAHSPGVLRYIEQEMQLAEPLPDPVYPESPFVDEPKYWAIQANPTRYDIVTAIAEQEEDTWTVDNRNLRVGDQLLIWKAKGSEAQSGIVGLAEVMEGSEIRDNLHLQYFRRDFESAKAPRERIVLRYVRSDVLPLWKEDLPPGLRDLSVAKGIQGNFFKVTPEQWEALMDYIGGWPEEYEPNEDDELMPDPTDPLNEILYGPPGTGKTYNTVQKSVQRIDGGTPLAMEAAHPRFAELRREGRIEFVTFHQSYGYEDFLEGLRPVLDSDTGTRYEIVDGALKRIALQALGAMLELAPRDSSTPERIPFETLWQKFVDEWENNLTKEYPSTNPRGVYRIDINEAGTVNANNIRGNAPTTNYQTSRRRTEEVYNIFRGSGESPTHTRIMQALGKSGHHGLTGALILELKRIESELVAHPETIPEDTSTPGERAAAYLKNGEQSGYRLNRENPPRYVLIMDEINRGNISKIFGELITLVEEDKRIGAPVELTVTLPLSRTPFALPPNLYLLGTMNTADKSIALVDVALRRRFDFTELMPDFEVCEYLTDAMTNVLNELNRRITLLKDRDHRIGHAFFMGVNTEAKFDAVWRTKLLPLLAEYFHGDWETLRAVLGEGERSGGLIVALPNPANLRMARNRWEWHPGLAKADGTMSIYATLHRNYFGTALPNDTESEPIVA